MWSLWVSLADGEPRLRHDPYGLDDWDSLQALGLAIQKVMDRCST
jgi:hypothetical protein